MSELYKPQSCPGCGEVHQLSEEQDKALNRLSANVSARWQEAIKKLQQLEDMNPETLSEPEVQGLIQATREAITSAMMAGFEGHTVSPELHSKLNEDVYYFSGFKTYASLKEASTMLHDEKGQLKPFNRFASDVSKLDETYNRNYLQAEYLYATASAESAARWTEQMQDADDYDLQYRTVGDNRVRQEHRALDLVTLPTRHAFWETYYPPNGWRCRCTVIQVRKGKYPTTADAVALEAGQAAISDKNKIFRGNPGREGTVFPENHPYYGQRGYGHCTVASIDLSATDDNEVCDVYRQLAKVRKGEYKKLRKETDKTLRQWAKTHYGQSSINGLQHDMRINNKAVQNFLGHARTIEEKEVLACLIDPDRKKEFIHIATEPLGLHKRMDVKKDADNVKEKRKRGVTAYNVYKLIDDNGRKWRIGFEVFGKDNCEQPYYILPERKQKKTT